MHTFGSSGIVTGYIKQLLASFNLPTLRIYTREHAEYLKLHYKERYDILESHPYDGVNDDILAISYVPYIKDGSIQIYVKGKWERLGVDRPWAHQHNYDRGQLILNKTKRLQIKNNIYDSYTHEYLGDYLRFIRDYDGLDLMPLYNCFSNRLSTNLKTSFTSGSNTVVLNSSDEQSKIYIVPVKLFKKYTIAIDSEYPVEMCCGLFNTALDTEDEAMELLKKTYRRRQHSLFGQPFLYSALDELLPPLEDPLDAQQQNTYANAKKFLVNVQQRERDLKLFIKVNAKVNSTITILEGDYTTWNDFLIGNSSQVSLDNFISGAGLADSFAQADAVDNTLNIRTVTPNTQIYKDYNRTVVSNEALLKGAKLTLISPLSLLYLNTKQQYPFSNKLLEYLLDNSITGTHTELRGNILMTQSLLRKRHMGKSVAAFDSSGVKTVPVTYSYNSNFSGVWDDNIRKLLYSYMTTMRHTKDTFDILGYVDKDVEKLFTVTTDSKKMTMLNYDSWEEAED